MSEFDVGLERFTILEKIPTVQGVIVEAIYGGKIVRSEPIPEQFVAKQSRTIWSINLEDIPND